MAMGAGATLPGSAAIAEALESTVLGSTRRSWRGRRLRAVRALPANAPQISHLAANQRCARRAANALPTPAASSLTPCNARSKSCQAASTWRGNSSLCAESSNSRSKRSSAEFWSLAVIGAALLEWKAWPELAWQSPKTFHVHGATGSWRCPAGCRAAQRFLGLLGLPVRTARTPCAAPAVARRAPRRAAHEPGGVPTALPETDRGRSFVGLPLGRRGAPWRATSSILATRPAKRRHTGKTVHCRVGCRWLDERRPRTPLASRRRAVRFAHRVAGAVARRMRSAW